VSDQDHAAVRIPALDLARLHPEMFVVRDGQVFVRPEADGMPCPCCGRTLKGSPLPRVEGEQR
jgi:hypothetical protein